MQGYEINPNEKIELNNSYIQNHTNSMLMVCDNDVGECFSLAKNQILKFTGQVEVVNNTTEKGRFVLWK